MNNSRLLPTAMDTALHRDEDDTDYRLQKLKRISSANLRSLHEGKRGADHDNLLCVPVGEKFVTSRDVLEEVLEPAASCWSSSSESGEPSIARSSHKPSVSNWSTTPAQSYTQSKPDFSMDRHIAQSQDRINQLLKESGATKAGEGYHHRFMNQILKLLRPHFQSLNDIETHLESPTDKWSAFVQYMAFLGTTVPDDETPNAPEDVHRARAGAIAQLSHPLELWQPQPAGPHTLHDLQFCGLKDIDNSLLDSEDRKELRKIVGMEDLARSLCNHAARFGYQWEENWKELLRGKPAVQMDNSQVANPQKVRGSLEGHKVTGEYLRTLKRNYKSMPHFHRDPHWQLDLPDPVPERVKAADRSSAIPKQPLKKYEQSQTPSQTLRTRHEMMTASLCQLATRTATDSEPMFSTDQHELFFEAPRIAPVVDLERNNWFAPSEWSSLPDPPPVASSSSEGPPGKPPRGPFSLIRSVSKRRPSRKATDLEDGSRPRDTLWHSNRTKGAQAQRLMAKRREAVKERKNKADYERYKELERRLEANGFLTPLGNRGDGRSIADVSVVASIKV
ncbi:hypothetical protein PMIN02_001607 [Paraphaeosphaeria minitans]